MGHIVLSLELPVAALVGLGFYQEPFGLTQIIGSLLIIGAVIVGKRVKMNSSQYTRIYTLYNNIDILGYIIFMSYLK